jgi:hypothetical protein
LPNGKIFHLDDSSPRAYLHHRSAIGEFFLTSDTVVPTFTDAASLSHIINRIPRRDREAFRSIIYTIGGMMIFPGNRIDGKSTINGARGFHPRIKDRFDLTLECIRRHYVGKESPLTVVLQRYADFFELFGNFRRYVEFFLLQDIVNGDFSKVKFFTPFVDFAASPLPSSVDEYLSYRQLAVQFVKARNLRIRQSSKALASK